jgi:hypothetical protein
MQTLFCYGVAGYLAGGMCIAIAWTISRIVIEVRRAMKSNRRVSFPRAKRRGKILRDGVYGDVTWLEGGK